MLDIMQFPDPEAFLQAFRHFQESEIQYQGDTQTLNAGQSTLAESWQGDGANAYSQSHSQIQQAGQVHQEQRQQVAAMLSSTVAPLGEAQMLQDTAMSMMEESDMLTAQAAIEAADPFTAPAAAATEAAAEELAAQAQMTQASAQAIVQGVCANWVATLQGMMGTMNVGTLGGMGGGTVPGDSHDRLNYEESDKEEFSSGKWLRDKLRAEKSLQSPDRRLGEVQTKLSQLQDFKPDQWKQLTPEKRLEALQNAHNIIAQVYGFTPNEVEMATFTNKKTRGAFYREEGIIRINSELIRNGDDKLLKTIAHESRHTYQYHLAQQDPASLSEAERIQADEWSKNFADYKSASKYGPKVYREQPIEADAFSFADTVTRELL